MPEDLTIKKDSDYSLDLAAVKDMISEMRAKGSVTKGSVLSARNLVDGVRMRIAGATLNMTATKKTFVKGRAPVLQTFIDACNVFDTACDKFDLDTNWKS